MNGEGSAGVSIRQALWALVLGQDKTLRMPGTSRQRAELPAGTTLAGVWLPLSVRSQGRKYTMLLWDGERPESSEDGGIFTLSNNNGCDKGSFDEQLVWRVEADGANRPRLVATVALVHAPKDFVAGCTPMPKTATETFANTYRWDAAKGQYRDEGGNLDRLYKWNERHM
jgi:hypothetical protein